MDMAKLGSKPVQKHLKAHPAQLAASDILDIPQGLPGRKTSRSTSSSPFHCSVAVPISSLSDPIGLHLAASHWGCGEQTARCLQGMTTRFAKFSMQMTHTWTRRVSWSCFPGGNPQGKPHNRRVPLMGNPGTLEVHITCDDVIHDIS